MKSSDLSYSQYLFGFLQYTDVHYLPDLNFLSLLLVDNAGDDELSFNCFFALIASALVISSFLINLFVTLALFFD